MLRSYLGNCSSASAKPVVRAPICPRMRLHASVKADAQGQPVRALDAARRTYAGWKFVPGSSDTEGRPYPELVKVPWSVDDAEKQHIRAFLDNKLGELMLPEDPQLPRTLYDDEVEEGEPSCNAMFQFVYGKPAAIILSALYGKHVVFKLGPSAKQHQGKPDFAFKMQTADGLKTIVVDELHPSEGKTPSVMQSVQPSIFVPDLKLPVNSSCQQICDYTRLRSVLHLYLHGLRYGFLTHLNGTIFVQRRGQDIFAFTDAFGPEDEDLTVLEMLLYVVIRQVEEGLWPDARPVEGPPAGNGSCSPSSPQGSGNIILSSSGSTSSSSSSTCHTAPRHPEDALQFTDHDECLGRGEFGYVVAASFYNQQAAIKALDLSQGRHMLPQLQNEVRIYDILKPLQGECIPKLLGYGLWHNDTTYFHATSIIRGQNADSSTKWLQQWSMQAVEAAEEALRRIHSYGVVHGDIRAQNILSEKDDAGNCKAWFLDFANSVVSEDAAQQAYELIELRQLLAGV